MDFQLQEAFQYHPHTVLMLEFAIRNKLLCTYNIKPKTSGCDEVAHYRINPVDFKLGSSVKNEVRSMLFSAETEDNTEILLEVDSKANKVLNNSGLRKQLAQRGIFLKGKFDAAEIGLEMGAINAISAKEAAAKHDIPFLLIVTDDLATQNKPFTHNAGTRERGVLFYNSREFYEAYAKESQAISQNTPGMLILPARMIAASAPSCTMR